MKTTPLLFTATLLFSGISVFTQDSKPDDPFSKGNWTFDLNRIATIQQTNYFYDGYKMSEPTYADINIQGLYFLSNGLGLGLNYHSNWSHRELYSKQSYILGVKLQYGISVGNHSYLYGRIGGGLGQEKDVTHVAGSDNNQNFKNELNNINAGIGFPIRLQKGGHTYFTPEVSWDRNSREYENRTVVENSFRIGLKLQTYLSPSEFNCGKKIDASTIHSRYDRGSQFIDFNSSGLYSLTKQTYNVYPDLEIDISGGELMVNYGYYIVDNFAIGAGLGFNTSKTNSGVESTSREWSFIPNLTFNLPVKNSWNNLFLNVEGGLGSSKTKADIGLGPNKYKEEFFTYGAYLGFNYLLSSQIALTPKLGYSFKNIEDSRSPDYDITSRTPDVSFGFRYMF